MRTIIKKKNKKGQFAGIIMFIGTVIGMIILAPIMLKIIGTILSTTSAAIGNQTVQDAATGNATAALNYGLASFNKFWDIIIVAFFFINVILLIISSFMIDVHPAFWVIYLFLAFIFFFISPAYTKALDTIWGSYSDVTGNLPNTSWIYHNFNFIMLGIYFITAIIIFAKIRSNR